MSGHVYMRAGQRTIQRHVMDSPAGCWLSALLLLLLAALTTGVESYTDLYIDGSAVEQVQHGPPQHPYLWFGPRLGRRKRTLDEDLLSKSPVIEESVISVFEDAPWVFGPMKNLQERPMMVRDEDELSEQAKAPVFAPRLGRRRKLLPFAPRLGRELTPPPQDRFERSASDEPGKAH